MPGIFEIKEQLCEAVWVVVSERGVETEAASWTPERGYWVQCEMGTEYGKVLGERVLSSWS